MVRKLNDFWETKKYFYTFDTLEFSIDLFVIYIQFSVKYYFKRELVTERDERLNTVYNRLLLELEWKKLAEAKMKNNA
jgi:hypothetical protein